MNQLVARQSQHRGLLVIEGEVGIAIESDSTPSRFVEKIA